ncbi:MAG: lysoplasmalogenase [Deltaproteobacteria bacterium]|nr:lysoplasmalogenase [Deltaproteobacteria bacterium]
MNHRALLVLALVAALVFVMGAYLDLHALRMLSKPWPVLLLAAWVWRSSPRDRFRTAMIAGLVCSVAGDLFLEASPRTLFLPGLVSFLVAHVCYVVAYVSDTRAIEPVRAIPAYAYGAGLVVLLAPGLGPMTIPVAIYALVICTMLWRAGACVGHATPTSAALALLGAITFAASDSLIAVGRFGGHLVEEALRTSTPWRLAIMASYWLGQWAIAASATTRSPAR